MIKLEISNRIKGIESEFNVPVKDLLYQKHWLEDMKHFIRGYFDGDGSITRGYFKRKDRHNKKTPYI